jgi:gliding motility-associated-like protein
VKENTNIEKLFKEKFESFEGNVDPSAWANISQGISSAGAGTAATGLSVISKVAIITGAVAVTAASIWYVNRDNDSQEIFSNEEIVVSEENNEQENNLIVSLNEEGISVEDTNDPVLQDNLEDIQEEFSTVQISPDDFDEELIEILMHNQNDSEITVTESTVDNNNVDKEENDSETVVDNSKEETEVVEAAPLKVVTDLQYEVDENTLEFYSGAENHLEVEWDFGDGNSTVEEEGRHEYAKPGHYDVTMKVTGEAGTTSYEFSIDIEGTSSISKVPNVFSPNRDGLNDLFFIESTDISEFLIVIYDMNNQEVFQSNDPNFKWNGERPDGTIVKGSYMYKIIAEGEDGAVHKEAGMLQVIK